MTLGIHFLKITGGKTETSTNRGKEYRLVENRFQFQRKAGEALE
jgi:hypothetical protein